MRTALKLIGRAYVARESDSVTRLLKDLQSFIRCLQEPEPLPAVSARWGVWPTRVSLAAS